MEATITLVKGREQSVLRKHPWIFSGSVKEMSPSPEDGDLVKVYDYRQNYLCTGMYQNGSICVRILSFEDEAIDAGFWENRIVNALAFRKNVLQFPNTETNCYRLFHGEGDGVSGLIIDIYGGTAVVQCHNIGIHKMLDLIVAAIVKTMGGAVTSIYHKSKDTLPEGYATKVSDGFLFGEEMASEVVKENGALFRINWVEGQKTGFFLDQRENRALVAKYSGQRTVLNCFCYTGGFSVYAGLHGASEVTSIDVSGKAMALTDENVQLNGIDNHQSITQNVLEYFTGNKEKQFDVVIIDPPAFAKSMNKRHNAVQAYKRLNIAAMKAVKSGGLMFTFSCSQVVTPQIFYDTVVAAGIESGRKVRVLQHLGQGPDHPVNLFHVEGHYLKGLMVEVE